MLKEQDIKYYIENRNHDYKSKSSIIAIIFPKKLTYIQGPTSAALSMQYYAINFSDSGISIIGLNNISGKLEDDSFLFIPKEEIVKIKFYKKMLSYELEIITTDGILSFKINKVMVGASWHKQNLVNVLNY